MQLQSTPLTSLQTVADIMRQLSRLTDPDDAAELYANGLRRFNLYPYDRYVGVSRRDLARPQFRVTRNSDWTDHPNPWTERHRLPLLSGGFLAEVVYGNEPVVLTDLAARVSRDDPGYPYLEGMELLIALPNYDGGESINMGLLMARSAAEYPLDRVPMMLWMTNLWGRATLNLVTRQKLQAAYQALDRELKVVGDIQRSLLPRDLPAVPGLDLAAHYQTSQRAGGDYYDFFDLGDGRWGVFVADVSGHGTPAAVLMAITHAVAHSVPGRPTPPASVLSFINRRLARQYARDSGAFVTAFYGVYDPATRALTYGSAGHPPPAWLRAGCPTCDRLGPSAALAGETGLPLGIAHDETYPEHTVTLSPGDRLLLYTDGIIEAFDPAGDAFGIDRAERAVAAAPPSARGVVDGVLTDLAAFTQDAPATDDRTLLALVVR